VTSARRPPRPRRPPSDRTAKLASDALQRVIHNAGWIYRTQEDQNDVGIDAEIEVVDDGDVMGWLLKVQVRGRSSIRWSHDTYRMTIKRSTYNEWLSVGLPVAVVLGDVGTHQLFWAVPYGVPEAADPDAAVPVTFDRSRVIDEDLTGLRRLIANWRAGYVTDHLSEIGPFFRMFRELEEGTGGDFFLAIDLELDDKFKLFSTHLNRLNVQVGALGQVPVPPHSAWVDLSRRAFPKGDVSVYCGVFDIAIDMIRADYFRALEKVRRHVVALTEHQADGRLWDLRQFLDALVLDAPTVAMDAAEARHRLKRLLEALANPTVANADPGPAA
jgi:Domain of unknown function (DUF4365)